MASKKYCEYFDVNESYFPCIDESAINAGAPWETTYPHETFIDLLNSAEKMLGGTTNRSIWIHGAYGTGKSQCAYALKKILEVPNDELRAYWDRYEPLKKNKALLEKLIGHKEQGVLTAYRYASGSITSPQLLFLAVQESIRAALDAVPGSYKGENTLKESVIAWLTDSSHNAFVNSLLQKPEWVSEFSQSSADEIINSLRKRSDVSSLMESIFKMAEKEGITALSLTADSLCAWIKDIVAQNHTKVVLIWDEFSGFFRQNRNSLDEFQKIVALCQETHFYFVIVTHPITSIAGASISKDDPMSVVQQRYKQIEITLPPNIAFELIGHAFSVIPAAKDQWEVMTGDLNSKISASKIAVMKAAVVKSDSVMQHMLPIHPMAALVLKNIASAFQSNQRSMFDFIKTPKDLDVHAFQWFIQNTRPDSDRSLLTVDMLWDFFYEKGKDYLTSDIKLILDTYPQQTNLTEKEKVVLKTILIMQAVDQRLGGTIPVLKATDQNLSYAFEGDWDVYENECKSIAKALVKKGVLIQTPIADGKQVYSAAVLAGDGAKIDRLKDEVRKNGTITKLVEEGTQLASALSLTPPLRLRYAVNTDTGALPVVTVTNFVKMMDQLKVKDTSWHFFAVLALARTDEEAQTFRNMIKKTIGNAEYKTILVIDALSSPLGLELFEEYVSYSAMSMYYNGNNNQQSKDNARKAREVLDRTWRDRIHDGSFIVWSYANQDGEKATGANAVHTIMQTVVLNRYNHVPDFTKGLTESQLKNTQTKQVAKYGFGLSDVKGLIAGCEKTVLGKVWNRDTYWSDQELEKEPISIIKRSVDKLIHEAFRENGRISIDEICELLETTYGFAPCNLTAFVLGFLLKEYKGDPFRSQDSEGLRESMTPDKLSEMIGNYYSKKAKTTYIVSLTPEEKSFYELTDNAATTKLDKDALAAMLPWLQDEYGNASQPYSFARKPKKALTDARATIAACIGAEPEEIYFTSGGTESDNWAIKGLIEPNDKHQTITSQIEHHAVLNACNALERLGYPVVYLPVDSQGVVLSDSLSKAITEKTKLVSVMMVNNEIGTIEPIKELATIAHTHNVLFHTDAVQAVGHIPIDVNELGIDMLSSSAHKFNGPKGIGFLYIRKGTQIRPLADGGAQEFHMRAGTENIASIVGMAVALKKNCRTMQETSTKLQAMDHAFIDVLHEANVDFIRNGSVSKSPGIISVSIRNISGEMLLHRLDLKGISISTGSACDSVNTQVSHVIKAIGVPSAYAQGTIRISFGHDNQIEDAVEIAHAIAKILQT